MHRAFIKAIILLPGNVLVLVPAVILFVTGVGARAAVPTFTGLVCLWAGLVSAAAGIVLAGWSMALFLNIGEGTPAPWQPPRKLVVQGPYRHVRNPTITGVLLMLAAEALLWRSWVLALWDFIAGEETRQLYRIIIDKARSERKSVQVPIRCDSPELRREIMISLKSVGNGHIEFLCRTMQVEARDPVDLLRRDVKRADSTIRICSFCKKIATPSDEWIDTELAIQRLALFIDTSLPQLRHGLCPSCHTAALAD